MTVKPGEKLCMTDLRRGIDVDVVAITGVENGKVLVETAKGPARRFRVGVGFLSPRTTERES